MENVELAKKAAHSLVVLLVSSKLETVVVDHTEIDEDSRIQKNLLSFGCGVVGQLVAKQTDPYTDALVDKLALRIEARRNKKAAKAE